MLQSNHVLQKEQIELFSIQRKLEKVLPVIQETLNSLKVEELHLKSLGLQNNIIPTRDPLHIDLDGPEMQPVLVSESEHINNQQLVDLAFQKLEQYDEEMDSD
ncbi:uncharacterized protein [Drosophila kikkawai]|uniref:Uncharacterized protein n=1 Tax=Drosophila kikkawai TaxID=30033 RepID=A0A6P4IRE6_DROKI|nr:uncharacterized protein LOC108081059 [Drosophila kikkawai]